MSFFGEEEQFMFRARRGGFGDLTIVAVRRSER